MGAGSQVWLLLQTGVGALQPELSQHSPDGKQVSPQAMPGQLHTPDRQVSPALQAVVQPPQCFSSSPMMFTQVPEQSVVPPGHLQEPS
jgi:hypothetical protein